MAKKKWRAKRAISVFLAEGDEYEKEYTEREEKLLLKRDIVEEVKPVPVAKTTAAKTTKEGAKDGKD